MSTAVEQVELALTAIAEQNHIYDAFVHVDAAGARTAAQALDGQTTRGPLHGLPIAVKDIIDVAGMPCDCGAPALVGHLPERDASVVAKLRSLGAVIVGKTATHQLAYGPTGDRTGGAPVRNPHDPSRMSGGSSAGSAAAVAAGMVPLALGTDTGGSVRVPAALCGVVGYKPSFGALSTHGVFPLAPSLDHVGFLADSVSRCAAAASALSIAPGPFTVAPKSIRWLEPNDFTLTDSSVIRTTRAELDRFPARIEHAHAAWAHELHTAFRTVQGWEAYSGHAERVRQAATFFDPEVLQRLLQAGRITAAAVARARTERAEALARLDEIFADADLLAMPTTAVSAPVLDSRTVAIGTSHSPVREALLAFTCPWNLLGLPALSLPAGTVDGLPVGLQLVARPGADTLLLTAALTAERQKDLTSGPRP
ncbi:amidase [Streptomyces sp. SRF1]|uniref:amidase n=1 Tax=Streptomyces sp. SRF1 TaxID=1549642 RepID=UPI00339D389F